MRGSDEEELELDGDADATVSLPVDEALAAALGADEAEEDAQATAHEAVRPAGALPATKVNAYAQPVSFEEPTFINDAQASAEIALGAESDPGPLSSEPLSSGSLSSGSLSSGSLSSGALSSGALSSGSLSPGSLSSGSLSSGPLSSEPRVEATPAQPASRERPSLGGWAVRGVIAAAMALGVGVIGHHLATAGARPSVGPMRLVAGSEAHVSPREAPRIDPDPADASRPIPELERAAAEALGAGRLEEAARRYAALANRVPHQPAYAAAARVLAAKVHR